MIRSRSTLGFFFLSKVITRPIKELSRQFPGSDNSSLLCLTGPLRNYPLLTRQRLFTKLLYLSPTSSLLALFGHLSEFSRTSRQTRINYVFSLHSVFYSFLSTHLTNTALLINMTRALAFIQHHRLTAWFFNIASSVYFVLITVFWRITNLSTTTKFNLFYFYSLTVGFRYIRTAYQPVTFIYFKPKHQRLVVTKKTIDNYTYSLVAGVFRPKHQQTNLLLSSILTDQNTEPSLHADIYTKLRLLFYVFPSKQLTRLSSTHRLTTTTFLFIFNFFFYFILLRCLVEYRRLLLILNLFFVYICVHMV